jgi:hypothetical protein
MTDTDAVLVGGPRDGMSFTASDAGLVELELDGMVHRYIRTTQRRGGSDAERTVYAYDGMVDPHGAQDGVENARRRSASPLAEDLDVGD